MKCCFDPELVRDDGLGSSSMRLSPHLGPLPVGEEESSFTLFQVRGAVAEAVTKRPKDLSLMQNSVKDRSTRTLPLPVGEGRGEGIEVIAPGLHIWCQ